MAALSRGDLARFFRALAQRLPCPATIVLTGGGEALVLGGSRPTGDVDFELVVSPRYRERWGQVENAVAAAASRAGIAVQYSADIDRWSSVSIPAPRRKARRLRRIGRLDVRMLDPVCWAVYKLARYLDSDVEDLRTVLHRQAVSARAVAHLCGLSLRSSPRSTQLFLFRRQVEHFLREHGRSVWGREFDAEPAIAAFRRAAQVRSAPRPRE